MATNLELPALREIVDPSNTLSMLALKRPLAESIANAMDDVLTGGKGTQLEALQQSNSSKGAPLLILNATRLDNSNPFVFALDNRTRSIFNLARTPDNSNLPKLDRSAYRSRSISYFDDTFGDVRKYRVADAVAASAAFPIMLGSISLGTRLGTTVGLSDGGLVDNLGLLTLYSLLLDPDLYRLTQGKLQRIIVISIDSETRSIHPGLFTGLEGLSTWSGEALHRFVIPAMIRSAHQRELGDVLESKEWKTFELPSPIFISYGACNGPDVPTRFRISEQDRAAVQRTADVCLLDANISKLEELLALPPSVTERVYDRRYTSADARALRAVIEIAEQEQYWWQWRKSTVDLHRLITEKPMWIPRARGNELRMAPQAINALDPKKLADTDYRFDIQIQSNGGAIVRATPRAYGQSGRISFYLELDPSLLDESFICDLIQDRIRGNDLQGAPAEPDAPLFAAHVKSCI